MKLRAWTLLPCFLLGPVLRPVHGQEPAGGDERIVVRAHHPNLRAVLPALSNFDLWHFDPQKKSAVLVLEAAQTEELARLGFTWDIDERQTKLLRRLPETLPGQSSGIPGFPCYRTVEETFAAAQALTGAYPDLAAWIDVGDSWEKTQDTQAGYDLSVLVLANQDVPGDKPKLMVTAGIHAREYTTAELATRLAEYLLDRYATDPDVRWLLDHHEVHLMLHTNPDGRKRAETGLSWRKNADNFFCANTDSRGIDLNRNFSFQWGCCGGSSSSECSQTFRGPFAGSEPETQAVEAYLESIFPDLRADDLTTPAPPNTTGIFFDLHSFGEVILSSWGFTGNPPPNVSGITTLMRKLGFYNGYQPNLGSLSTVDGATKDFAYGTLGVPSYTIEMGTTFFEDCSFFEQNILPQNRDALIQAAKWVRLPYGIPSGPEFESVGVDEPAVAPGTAIIAQGLVDDDRYNHGSGTEPTQNIQGAEVYVDLPPWSAGASPLAMAAVDGDFDQVAEQVTTPVDTSALENGEHLLFFRGLDSAGNWGAVSAAFFFVLDPATAPRIEGIVSDAATGLPLQATVSSGLLDTDSDPDTGFYSLLLPAGTHDATAEAPGYLPATTSGISLSNGETVVLNFSLVPTCAAFADDMEAGVQGWQPQGGWSLTTASANSPSHSWTDSPGGNYGPNANFSLTSQAIDLTAMQGVSLSFWHRYQTEPGFDFGVVEVSPNDGLDWFAAASFSGDSGGWRQETIDLPNLDGLAQAWLRFRFVSDSSLQDDGWYLDDIRVTGGSLSRCAALTFFQMIELWPVPFNVLNLVAAVNVQ